MGKNEWICSESRGNTIFLPSFSWSPQLKPNHLYRKVFSPFCKTKWLVTCSRGLKKQCSMRNSCQGACWGMKPGRAFWGSPQPSTGLLETSLPRAWEKANVTGLTVTELTKLVTVAAWSPVCPCLQHMGKCRLIYLCHMARNKPFCLTDQREVPTIPKIKHLHPLMHYWSHWIGETMHAPSKKWPESLRLYTYVIDKADGQKLHCML